MLTALKQIELKEKNANSTSNKQNVKVENKTSKKATTKKEIKGDK